MKNEAIDPEFSGREDKFPHGNEYTRIFFSLVYGAGSSSLDHSYWRPVLNPILC